MFHPRVLGALEKEVFGVRRALAEKSGEEPCAGSSVQKGTPWLERASGQLAEEIGHALNFLIVEATSLAGELARFVRRCLDMSLEEIGVGR